jgi:hypothetical protein
VAGSDDGHENLKSKTHSRTDSAGYRQESMLYCSPFAILGGDCGNHRGNQELKHQKMASNL